MDVVAVVAALWGFAEATLFFIVPDVWLTVVAVTDGTRAAVRANVAAMLGAIAGGFVTYRRGRANPAAARRALAAMPGISVAMIERVAREIREQGIRAMLWGPLRGVPYKIYAVSAGAQGRAVMPFLLVSIPGRIPRMALLTLIALGLNRWCVGSLPVPGRCAIVGALWLASYVWYFRAMSRATTRAQPADPR
jgi:membrane protein YqaA with SNARE-associated domain